jgi:uncharacterized Zn finger protein
MEEHNCQQHYELIKCDGETDTVRCIMCGKEWQRPCNFDEDYD